MNIRLHLLLGLLAGMLLTTALALLAAWPHWAAWQRGGQLEVVHWETPVSIPADEANGDLPNGQDADPDMAVGGDNQGKTTAGPAAGGGVQTFDSANPLAAGKHASDQAQSHDPLLHGASDAERLNAESRAAPAEAVLPAGPEGTLLVHDPVEVDPFWWVCVVAGIWCLTMVLLVGTLWLLGVRLLAPLMDLQSRMAEMATGEADLSVTMPVRGIGLANTMALAFNGFMKRLNVKIAAVKGASSEAAEGTHLIAQVSQEMAFDLVKQQRNAQVIDEAASGMVEDAQAVSMMAKQACDQVDAAVETAREGVDVVMVAMSSMQDVIDAVEKASGWMTSLRDQSGSIGQMVDVINDIAEHINMLSLNAGVEAARAGEKGRGFAVVAEEISKLADRTTAATQQIIDSILNMQTVTDEARNEMGQGVQTVSQGLGRAKERLQTIVSDVDGVSGLIQQVSERARHQSTSCIDIQRSVISIRKSLDTSVNASEENATSVEQLSVKAKQVNGLLADLTVYDRRAHEGEIPQEVADRRSGPNLNENIRRILKVFVSPNIDDLIEQTMADMAAGKSIDMDALENMDLSAFGVPDAGAGKH